MIENYVQGYISDVKVTQGVARYSTQTSLRQRLAVLWAAIKHLFTGKGIYLTDGVKVNLGCAHGITFEQWIRPSGKAKWEHWAVTFDGEKPANAYIDGKVVE